MIMYGSEASPTTDVIDYSHEVNEMSQPSSTLAAKGAR